MFSFCCCGLSYHHIGSVVRTCKSSYAEKSRVAGPSGIIDFLCLFFFISNFEGDVKDNDV